jgi:propanediol dehydratase small subunit
MSYIWWVALVIVVLLLATIPFEIKARRRLRVYWDRRCTGIQWRRRFPSASKHDIRAFLAAFVDGFAFPRKRRLCFSPDDKIIEVYRTLYPSPHTPDSLEMETFTKVLKDRYALDVERLPQREYTLGELFALTHPQPVTNQS